MFVLQNNDPSNRTLTAFPDTMDNKAANNAAKSDGKSTVANEQSSIAPPPKKSAPSSAAAADATAQITTNAAEEGQLYDIDLHSEDERDWEKVDDEELTEDPVVVGSEKKQSK